MDFESLSKISFFNTYRKRISVLSIIVIILSVYIATVSIGKTQDVRTEARVSYTGMVPPGCYYTRPACPANLSFEQARIGCKPVLVCPTVTPARPFLKLTCSQCLGSQRKFLCFDRVAKASYCSEFPIVDSAAFCVSCVEIEPEPTCVPPPPCVYSEPRCLIPEPVGGWCPTVTPITCLTPPPCPGGKLMHGDPVPDVLPRCPIYTCVQPTTTPTECRSYGSCAGGQQCPAGTVCSGLPAYWCIPPECPAPICLSSSTTISTPQGEVRVTDLRQGMSVWSVTKDGKKVTVSLLTVSRAPVGKSHQMIHVVLADGRELSASAGHPTADGRTVDQLKAGDELDGSVVKTVESVPYNDAYTYDIFPDGDTGFYFANGILMGTTLK